MNMPTLRRACHVATPRKSVASAKPTAPKASKKSTASRRCSQTWPIDPPEVPARTVAARSSTGIAAAVKGGGGAEVLAASASGRWAPAGMIEENRTDLAKTRTVRHHDFDLRGGTGAWREMTMNIGSDRWKKTKLSSNGAAACW